MGRARVVVEKNSVEFALGLPRETADLAIWWTTAKRFSGPRSLLMTGPVEESRIEQWQHSQVAGEPSLVLSATEGGRGRLFIRGCKGNRYRRYADIVFPPGSLVFQQNSLVATNVRLESIDEKTWNDVARGCGDETVPLPATPLPAIGSLIAGSPAPAVGDSIHQSLDTIRFQLEDLVTSSALKWHDAMKLASEIDEASEHRRSGDSVAAIDSLDRIVKLASSTAPALLNDIAVVRSQVLDSVHGSVGVLRPPKCQSEIPCPAALPLHVDAMTAVAGAEQDGSVERPFSSIAGALGAAESRSACAVSIDVADGTYTDDLRITRDTFINGVGRVIVRGSMENTGAHRLTIHSVSFSDTPRAAISVANPCALTSLRDLRIESAADFGVDIEGGGFAANDIRIASTRGSSLTSSGVAIRLRGGTRAAIARAELTENEGGALAVIGDGTRVFARALIVTNNHALGTLGGLLGAVSALDGALLLVETSVIKNNEGYGLQAVNSSRLHFRAGHVSQAFNFVPPFPGVNFGVNVLTAFNSILEMNTFTVSHGELAGLQFTVNALARLSHGEVTDHPIGANVQSSDALDLNCLLGGTVAYRRNRANLDAVSLPLPDDGPPPPAVCATVPFTCDWCVFD